MFLRDGQAFAHTREVSVTDNADPWFQLAEGRDRPLTDLDVVLMRKDPPFNMEFVYTTYILERAEQAGVLVVNKPQSLRDANEKMYTAWFSQCCPPTLVAREQARLAAFLAEHEDIIVKPLDGMGGASIFRINAQETNSNVIFELLTDHDNSFAMAQRYVHEITTGDKAHSNDRWGASAPCSGPRAHWQ